MVYYTCDGRRGCGYNGGVNEWRYLGLHSVEKIRSDGYRYFVQETRYGCPECGNVKVLSNLSNY